MTSLLSRSSSVNETNIPVTGSSLARSLSYSATRRNGSPSVQFSSDDALKNATRVKFCLLDAKAQMDKFVKEYPLYWDLWNIAVVIRYGDAEKRLPSIATQLDRSKLESLLLVKNILTTMGDNLVKTLKPSVQTDKQLSSYLERAEHATGNAMVSCVNGTPEFRFEKSEQKDLYSSNDIMSAAMIIQRYLADVTNGI
ncbi:uncharacterized protein LOC123537231 [Mercenaria mercenaria]|uniref:uncharacterized protein LOC123537231 n=1 Tax=Mercenaria mercenaria TaxID=6596 RepID=UPI00234EE85E|nr:uncharacterized protein LOC123537231 [Mercenaria mercenaria]